MRSARASSWSTAVKPGMWVVSSREVNAAGKTVAIRHDTLRNLCHLPEGDFQRNAFAACGQRLGIHSILTVQPANRYWPFQAWETGTFAVLAAALIAFAFWWTLNRIT